MIHRLSTLLLLPLLLAGCQTGGPAKSMATTIPAATLTVTPKEEVAVGWVDRPDAAGLRYGPAPFLLPRQVAGLSVSGKRTSSRDRDIDGLVQYGVPGGQDSWVTFFVYKASAFDADLTVLASTQAAAILSAPGRRLVVDGAMPLPGGGDAPVLRHLLWQEEVGRASTLAALSAGGWVLKLRVSGPDRAAVEQTMQAALAGVRVDADKKPGPLLAADRRPKPCLAPQHGPKAKQVGMDIGSTLLGVVGLGEGMGASLTWPPDAAGDVCIEMEGKDERRPFILLRSQDAATGKTIGWIAPVGDAGAALECAPNLANAMGLEGATAKYMLRLHVPGGGEVLRSFDALPNRDQMLEIIRQIVAPLPPQPTA